MSDTLNSLFGQTMIPCPHCGTKNAADSEACLCCGLPLSAEANPAQSAPAADVSAPDEAVPPVSDAAVSTVIAPASGDDAAPAPQKRPRRPWLTAAVAALHLVMIAAIVLQVLYSISPAHKAVDLLESRDYEQSHAIWLSDVAGSGWHERILAHRMTEYFDKLTEDYHSGEIVLSNYAIRSRSAMEACPHTEVCEKIKHSFQVLLEQTHADYVRSFTEDVDMSYSRACDIFNHITSRGLEADPVRARTLYDQLHQFRTDEATFSFAAKYEMANDFVLAVEHYQMIPSGSPLFDSAQEGIAQCIPAFCTHIRTLTAQPEEALQLWTPMESAKKMCKRLPDDAALAALYREVSDKYIALKKAEVLDAHIANTQSNDDIVVLLRDMLLYWAPDDADLLAALQQRAAQWKSDRYKEMPAVLQDIRLFLFVEEYLPSIVLPGDPDTEQLYADALFYQSNDWSSRLSKQTQIEHLFFNHGKYHFAPVTDAAGRRHQPYSLYRLTGGAVGTANSSYGTVFRKLTLDVSADAACTGTAVLEVWASATGTDSGVPMKKIWTSPVLDRTTAGLEVELELAHVTVEVRLVTQSGAPVMLLDNVFLTTETPA